MIKSEVRLVFKNISKSCALLRYLDTFKLCKKVSQTFFDKILFMTSFTSKNFYIEN